MVQFQNGHALVIGAGGDLPVTAADAKGLADILKDEARCAYPSAQVQTLTDSTATRAAILTALDTLARTTHKDSCVVIYFSGHGYCVSSSFSETYYLMPYGYNTFNLKNTAISGAEFAAKLQNIPAQKLLVLLDCCHAGGVGDAKLPPGVALASSPIPPEALDFLAQGSGRVLIASSREDEKSYVAKPFSVFTLALIGALAGKGVAKQDGYVRVADLALYAREKVPGWTQDLQHPILHFEGADNFVLAYYAGGDQQPKDLAFALEPVVDPVQDNPSMTVIGDHVVGVKNTVFDMRGQKVTGPQANIQGDGNTVFSGKFNGPVAASEGEAMDARGSQGFVNKPNAPVTQYFQTSAGTETPTIEEFLQHLALLRQTLGEVGLEPEVEQSVNDDLAAAEQQARKEKPNRLLLLNKLGSAASLLANMEGVWALTEKVQPLLQQVEDWAQRLFA